MAPVLPSLEDIKQGLRSWFMTYASGDAGVTVLTDAQCILGKEFPEVRPDKPYVSVGILTAGVSESWDEEVHGTDGTNATTKTQSHDRATVEIIGYGLASFTWMRNAVKSLHATKVVEDLIATHGISMLVLSGPTSVTVELDTFHEQRFLLELEVHYLDEGATFAETAVTSVVLTTTIYRDSETETNPAPLVTVSTFT